MKTLSSSKEEIGVIINLGDGTFEILINQDASDKEGVVRHEIEHLVGMTHPEDEHEEHDHDEEAWKENYFDNRKK